MIEPVIELPVPNIKLRDRHGGRFGRVLNGRGKVESAIDWIGSNLQSIEYVFDHDHLKVNAFRSSNEKRHLVTSKTLFLKELA
jgi:hypothetical protein